MADQRILMNIPAGQRKPKPVPIGNKKVKVTNLNLSSGQVELSIPDSILENCVYIIIPYNPAQNIVERNVDFYGQTICCYNNNLVGGMVDLEIL